MLQVQLRGRIALGLHGLWMRLKEECVGAGKSPGSEEGKRVVVRWSIAPSGKVKDVVTETAAFQGTALAHCLEAKIRNWTFPKHREQGGAVRFPFVF